MTDEKIICPECGKPIKIKLEKVDEQTNSENNKYDHKIEDNSIDILELIVRFRLTIIFILVIIASYCYCNNIISWVQYLLIGVFLLLCIIPKSVKNFIYYLIDKMFY